MARITESSLPQLTSPRIEKLGWSESSDNYRTYASILQAECVTIREADTEKLISIRVAGYLFLEFLTQSGSFGVQPGTELVKWLTSPPLSSQKNQRDVVIETGKLLRDEFIRVFRTTTTAYSPPSSHPSRPSFDSLEDMIKDSMEPSGKDYRTPKKKSLARDGYRCVITGRFNEASFKPEARKELRALPLQTAHIFNESTMQGIDPTISEDSPGKRSYKTQAAAGALAILESFGFSRLANAFKEAGGVHQVWNLLTLQRDLHTWFDNLNLWFEHTDKPHRYKVCTLYEYQEDFIHDMFAGDDRPIDGAPMFVEFNAQHEHDGWPPPDPLLLAIHAACARVAHMSGAAEFFDEIERDVEEMTVLAFDGSSASLLSHLLSPYAVIHGVA